MKKLLTIIFFLCSATIFAQRASFYTSSPHEVRLSYGYLDREDYPFYSYNAGNAYENGKYYLGSTKSSGVFGISYFYHPSFINGRFSFGGSLQYSQFNTPLKKLPEQNKIKTYHDKYFMITPSIRYAWVAKDFFQIYSGIGVQFCKSSFDSDSYIDGSWETNIDINLIGASIGTTYFGFAEININGNYSNYLVGVGYRF